MLRSFPLPRSRYSWLQRYRLLRRLVYPKKVHSAECRRKATSIIKTFPIDDLLAAFKAPLFDLSDVPDHAHHCLRERLEPPVRFLDEVLGIFFVSSRIADHSAYQRSPHDASRPSRPDMSPASCSNATISSVISLIATSEGSSRTTPRPFTAMIVLAVQDRPPLNPLRASLGNP